MQIALPGVLALLATFGFSLLFIHRARAWNIMDIPEGRKVHSVPTPRTGGLAMVSGGLATWGTLRLLGQVPSLGLPWQTWAAGAGFISLGALDDRFSFRPSGKFKIFLALGFLAAWPWAAKAQALGGFSVALGALSLKVGWPWVLGILAFWFVAVPNAVNIEDAINGYMGGYTLIVISVATFQGVGAVIPAGALMGFLLLNWPKARHFMGDAGSFGCGFLIAESLLRAGAASNPILALALTAPIAMDVTMGLVRRWRLGQSFFEADRSTFPHHLLRFLDGSTTQASLLLWVNALLFALARPYAILLILQTLLYAFLLVSLNWRHLKRGVHIPD